MIYTLILSQNGGCDHTIGCGIKIINFASKTYEGALIKAREKILDYSDDEIDSATLLEVSKSLDLDIDSIFDSRNQELDKQAKELEEIAEKALLKKLKEKYEND